MPLHVGSRIGPYEVNGLLGEGGMGQVFRARDTRLHREVALKVLPDGLAADPDRVARFAQEARALAALNHSGIAAIYGLEEAHGTHALVLELVPGPTLEDRLARGPIPVAEALRLAEGIAAALEAAHEQGIVHRDLKPANLKIRDDGTVKVLDFGLAKALRPAGAEASAPLASDAATLAATRPGAILGTVAYMSPEQARAEPVDTRTDVWSFGCVLYEMLTGRRPFHGSSAPEILANLLKEEPDFAALPAGTPPLVRRLLRRCLEKDRRLRLRHIGDARADLRDSLSPSGATLAMSPAAADVPAAPARAGRLRAMAAALLATAAAAGFAGWQLASRGRAEAPPPEIVSFEIAGLPGAGFERTIAISPDGARVVHAGSDGLALRELVRSNVVAREWGGAKAPFFSPDGRWVGSFSGFTVELWRIPVGGGAPIKVANLGVDARLYGASWGADDRIVFATTLGLHRVPADGGVPELLVGPDTEAGELYFGWPEILPGGRTVLFSVVLRGTAQV
ncbi:MAG TPA: serine/threonine-protein kinase, partial [Planctomycetota bacterium]|nr:serine/threonine-protein kinase [Planctomycetota bacterium]